MYLKVGQIDFDLSVQTTGPGEGGVEGVGSAQRVGESTRAERPHKTGASRKWKESKGYLLVAMMTLMLPRGSKPSSWLMSSSIVLCTSLSPPAPSSKRVPPMASTSSKKIMQAFLERAISNNSLTILAPSPTYFCTSSLPITRMKVASVLKASRGCWQSVTGLWNSKWPTDSRTCWRQPSPAASFRYRGDHRAAHPWAGQCPA